jgi:hypothetical protein
MRVRVFKSFAKFFAARAIARRAVRRGELGVLRHDRPDSLFPSEVPSIGRLGMGDRVLAELDQDGFAFALDPSDVPVFNRREQKMPRLRHLIDVVLHDGVICLRKRFRRPPPRMESGSSMLWHSLLGLGFYQTVAASHRLRGLPCVAAVRKVDWPSRTVYMDYIRGDDLRHQVSQVSPDGKPVHDLDLFADPALSSLTDDERDQREIEIFSRTFGDRFGKDIRESILAINDRGVALMDVKLGNIIVGEKTGKVYWVDLERSELESFPDWDASLQEQRRHLDRWFNLGLASAAR